MGVCSLVRSAQVASSGVLTRVWRAKSVKLVGVGGCRSGGEQASVGSGSKGKAMWTFRAHHGAWSSRTGHQLHGTRVARTAGQITHRAAQAVAAVWWRRHRAAKAQWELP